MLQDVRIYELRGNKLVNTWRSTNFPKPFALRLCPTGPSSAIAFDEAKDIFTDPALAINERVSNEWTPCKPDVHDQAVSVLRRIISIFCMTSITNVTSSDAHAID